MKKMRVQWEGLLLRVGKPEDNIVWARVWMNAGGTFYVTIPTLYTNTNTTFKKVGSEYDSPEEAKQAAEVELDIH